VGGFLVIGMILGHYEIISPLGSGGMGEVWKARDTRLGRVVAIKKVREKHGERFKQEARSIAALNHTNICRLFDIGPDYLVLEYVEGKPYQVLFQKKKLSVWQFRLPPHSRQPTRRASSIAI
jgi:serine/threonine protein kinase